MNFTASTWKNGQPSIEVSPYQHRKASAEEIAGFLTDHPDVQMIGPVPEVAAYTAKFDIDGEPVDFHMDDVTCSFGFRSASIRDGALAQLKMLFAPH